MTLGGIIRRGGKIVRTFEKIWLRRTHISFSGTTPLISDRALNIPSLRLVLEFIKHQDGRYK
jgi:hypothetical protein